MAEEKYMGRDCELSTTGLYADGRSIDPWLVTRDILARVEQAASNLGAVVWSHNAHHGFYAAPLPGSAQSVDCLRHWLSGGQCLYADMAHVEVCTPSCLEPRTFAAQSIATLLIAEEARRLAQLESETGTQYHLSTSNTDLSDPSVSFGSHLSVSVSTSLWENLFVDPRRPAVLGFVASVMAAAIPLFGAGYLLPTNGQETIYSLSARAHHLTRMQTLATTEKWNRGLLNSRREAHGTPLERLHLIGFDYTILASALLASLVGCALAAAEEGFCGLNLYDPVDALRRWSWSLNRTNGRLPATALLIDGRHLTLPEYIRELATTLLEMRENRLLTERIAPKAESLLPKIIDLSHYVEEGSLQRTSVHLDWAAKLLYLMQGDGPYGDAAMRLADHDFANTNPSRGPIWRLWESGLVDPLVTMDDVRACLREPPPESRDWGRGRVIERFAAEIAAIDWSHIVLTRDGPWNYPQRKTINLPQLDSFNQRQFQHLIDAAGDVEGLLDLLEKEASQIPAPNVPRENP